MKKRITKKRSEAEKLQLIAEAEASGNIQKYFKSNGMSTSQYYNWKKRDFSHKPKRGGALHKPETFVLPPKGYAESGKVMICQGSPEFIAAVIREMR